MMYTSHLLQWHCVRKFLSSDFSIVVIILHYYEHIFICPIAIASHGTDYKIEIWHRHLRPEIKEPFCWG